jgi:hypothetical protein
MHESEITDIQGHSLPRFLIAEDWKLTSEGSGVHSWTEYNTAVKKKEVEFCIWMWSLSEI